LLLSCFLTELKSSKRVDSETSLSRSPTYSELLARVDEAAAGAAGVAAGAAGASVAAMFAVFGVLRMFPLVLFFRLEASKPTRGFLFCLSKGPRPRSLALSPYWLTLVGGGGIGRKDQSKFSGLKVGTASIAS
jgi:hypothetical protein